MRISRHPVITGVRSACRVRTSAGLRATIRAPALDHRDRLHAGVAQRQHGRERHQLAADDDRSTERQRCSRLRPAAAARRSSARSAAGRRRPAARSEASRGCRSQAGFAAETSCRFRGRRQRHLKVVADRGDGRAGDDPRCRDQLAQPSRHSAGPVIGRKKSVSPKVGMRAIARDSTRLRLALDHDDAVDAALRQARARRRGRRARRRRSGRPAPPSSRRRPERAVGASDWTAAVQPNPWQRPIMARVRRFNPPSVPGAIGASSAARISVSVTHSQ